MGPRRKCGVVLAQPSIVGGLSLAAGIANQLMLSAPAWTWIEIPFYLVFAWLAGRLEVGRRSNA